jgi:glycosyltransferase involved in cell wall biosynthesis
VRVSDARVSVVLPCLDEEDAIATVVDQAWAGIAASGHSGEVIVVDNGSTDRSAEIARAHGARVVTEKTRGYGAAYLTGLEEARGEFVVMADADGTYPLDELAPFVERLERGDDLVIGSRFDGRIHHGAMPWANRYLGNPFLTGLLNVLFGVKVSDAHCGMRAIRRDALPALDLHSTGMELASEMVFKAYRRRLSVGELPIEYFPRTGESKLRRSRDAWRHVRFMLLYSPSWLYLLPGTLMLLLGLAGMLLLASGPIDVFGRTWQIHTMLAFVAMTLIGAQVVQLGLFARTYARVTIGEHDPVLDRLGKRLRLEHGLLAGGVLVLAALGILAAIFASWATGGFGALEHEYPTALGLTLLGLGLQIVFGSFFLALLTMPLSRATRASPAPEAEELSTAAEPMDAPLPRL